jgi:hypothetical protein
MPRRWSAETRAASENSGKASRPGVLGRVLASGGGNCYDEVNWPARESTKRVPVMRRFSVAGSSLVLGLLATVPAALGQQGPNFNRVNNLRREVTITPGSGAAQDADASTPAPAKRATAARARRAPSRQPEADSFSLGNPGTGRAAAPPSIQVRTTPHTFYPGMRSAQGPNRNVPTLRRPTSRGGVSMPGMMGGGLGLPGPSLSPGRTHR